MDDVLIVERRDGRIRYPIKFAGWNLYEDKKGNLNLYLQIDSDLPIREPGRPPSDEWWDNNDRPWWFVKVIQPGLLTSSIAPGAVFSLPEGYDKSLGDSVTNILFDGGHQPTDQNTISILAVDGERLRVRMEGQTIHETWHEPVTTHTYAKLTAEAWFAPYDFWPSL